MYVLMTGFLLLNLLFSFIDSIVVGSVDITATKLTSALSNNATTLQVQNTGGFRVADWVRIGDEMIAYNGKTNTSFTNCDRGWAASGAVAHSSGSIVYARMSDIVNTSVGFNIVDTGASVGTIDVISLGWRFATTTIPGMVAWNFYFLKEGFWQYGRVLLVTISGALVFVLAMQLLSAFGGLMQSAFGRR